MVRPILSLGLLVALARPAAAQTEYYATLGVTGASALVHDEIFQPVVTRQSLAPTLTAGVTLGIGPRYGLGLEGSLATGSFHATESGTSSGLGHLTTGTLLLNLSGPVASAFRWRAGVGLVRYLPGSDAGIFLRGGTTRYLAGAGVDYRRPVSRRLDLMASLRADYHRFTTDELKARGFAQSQPVGRIAVGVGLAGGRW